MNATLPAKLCALPETWVEKIFSRMAACYGTLFTSRWQGIDLVEVKQVWSDSLASFSDNPQCFANALSAMVEQCKFPPTLPEFVELCRSKYEPPRPIALENLNPSVEVSREEGKRRIDAIAKQFFSRKDLAAGERDEE